MACKFRLVPLVLTIPLLGLAGCAHVSAGRTAAVTPSPAPAAADARPPVLMSCGHQLVSVVEADDELHVLVKGTDVAMAPALAASGEKYEVEGNSGSFFWRKGGKATLQVDGQRYPECELVERGPRLFEGKGNEPSWRVTGYDRYCQDSMTGMTYPHTVVLYVNGQRMTGCGGDPGTLIRGTDWLVEDINRGGMVDRSRVSFRFGNDGRITGNASCNRFMGGYTLGGEGLVLTQMASTQMACSEALMAQELKFLSLLPAVKRFDFSADGALVLHTGEGATITARRAPPEPAPSAKDPAAQAR
ncbi:MAG: META domain-containing protein [Gammaproteobacteria bacterium]